MASIRSRVGRAVLIAGVLAMAAFTVPAHAAGELAPTLLQTSLVNGWSHFNNVLSAQYDSVIVRASSSVAVTDKNSAVVDGVTTVASADKTILLFTPDVAFSSGKAPYTATFTAHALDQDPALANTVDTMSFKVDTIAPATATNYTVEPLQTIAGMPLVLGPTDSLKISGKAFDVGPSGVSRVELHFYNAVEKLRRHPSDAISSGTPPTIRFDEVREVRKSFSVSCAATCPANATYTFTNAASGLNPGQWSVKIAVVDLAGNVGGESATIDFVLVGVPA